MRGFNALYTYDSRELSITEEPSFCYNTVGTVPTVYSCLSKKALLLRQRGFAFFADFFFSKSHFFARFPCLCQKFSIGSSRWFFVIR